MRLLHTSSISLYEFYGDTTPPYAILSHTWGEEEVSFQELARPESKRLAGYQKIIRCCKLARWHGWKYVWIDTCCIDKTSSAELSEAINSMFRWYREARVCYAYLVDVAIVTNDQSAMESFCGSRWFTRGWTLQELLAPEHMTFYDHDWTEIGTKQSLQSQILKATGINEEHINNHSNASAAQKMSWASRRKTTRVEDISYCLMGLFDVNMPLLYGEGKKAFIRLQHEIARISDDESLFAWNDPSIHWSGMFAQSPAAFVDSGDVIRKLFPQFYRKPWSVTNRGLAIDIGFKTASAVLTSGDIDLMSKFPVVPLHCVRSEAEHSPICIRMHQKDKDDLARWGLSEVIFGKGVKDRLHQAKLYENRTMYIRPLCTPKRPGLMEIQSFVVSPPLLYRLYSVRPYVSDEGFGAWDSHSGTVVLARGFAALLFRNGSRWSFLLILRNSQSHSKGFATLDVTTCEQSVNPERAKSLILYLYGEPQSWENSKSTTYSGPLQDQSMLSIRLRQGITPGERYYFVDMDLTEAPLESVQKSAPQCIPEKHSRFRFGKAKDT